MTKTLAMFSVSGLDLAALVFFVVTWIGYGVFADLYGRRVPSLTSRMGHYRRAWMREMLGRENRMADVSILQKLATSAQFFASTTMLILGALVALMGYTEKVVDVVAEPARWLPTDRAVGDASRLRKATGWEPAVAFEATLRALLAGARGAGSAAGRGPFRHRPVPHGHHSSRPH